MTNNNYNTELISRTNTPSKICFKILSLILFTFSNISYSYSFNDSINKIDSYGKRQGKWIITNAILKIDCYKYDQKVKEGGYVNSRKNGFWLEYYCNKKLKSKISYVNNRPNGYAILYFESWKIKEEGLWKNNRWIGAYKLYYSNGNVQQNFNFNSTGKREGKQVYFHENGNVMIEGEWNRGKEFGIIKEYHANGDIRSVKDYTNGVLTASESFKPTVPVVVPDVIDETINVPPPVVVKKTEKDNLGKMFNGEGYWQLYNGNRQITKDGTFHKNRLIEGKAYFYNSDGILLRIAKYRRGKYIGDAVMDVESQMQN
jgi:antitoxin component YwqK of YwqJK toxin-antitoxin module